MNEEIQRIEMTIEQAEAKIKKADSVRSLLANPLFKEIITDGYLGDDAVRLTMNLKPGDENTVTMSMLNAKSIFSRYIAYQLAEGEQAAGSLEEHRLLMLEVDKES